jgi:4-cresol dehydrogenase (hydroxylating)
MDCYKILKETIQEDDATILNSIDAKTDYGLTTFSEPIDIDAAIIIKNKVVIPQILAIANKLKWNIYPISSGKNWGYGSISNISQEVPKVVIDLSQLTTITPTAKELGLITIESGVTQKQLYNYLEKNDWNCMVPVTGAGPQCSIVSNALERGYGITPYTDHFSAVTALKAYLPHPDLCEQEYCSAISSLDGTGNDFIDKTYKWGVGSYIDGLFTQSNLGIVTEMSIRLARKPNGFCAFYLQCFDESKFEQLVLTIRVILRELEGIVGSINLMDQTRLISMVADNPQGPGQHAVMSAQQVLNLARQHRMPKWMLVGSIYGEPEIVQVAKRLIKKKTAGLGKLLFSDSALIKTGRWISHTLPFGPLKGIKRQLAALDEGVEIMQGKPNQRALPLAYWRNPHVRPDKRNELNPAKDKCGLLWYAPLIPMQPKAMQEFVEFIRSTTPKYGIEPLVTFTNLRHDCVDSTIPIVFNLNDEKATQQAHQCLDVLVQEGLKKGYVPYRLNTLQQKSLLIDGMPYKAVMMKLKQAIDPNQIISPDRY